MLVKFPPKFVEASAQIAETYGRTISYLRGLCYAKLYFKNLSNRMPVRQTQSALQEAGFYATRKIKLKNQYKRNSSPGEADCVCRRFSIAQFFFHKALDSMSLSDGTQSCCTRLPFLGRLKLCIGT